MMLLCLARGLTSICMQLHDAMLGHQHLHCESQRAVCLRLLELQRVFQTTVCGVGFVHCISVLSFAERIHIQLNLLCYAACKRKWFDTDKIIMHIQNTGPALQSVNNGEVAMIRLTNVFVIAVLASNTCGLGATINSCAPSACPDSAITAKSLPAHYQKLLNIMPSTTGLMAQRMSSLMPTNLVHACR